MQRVYIVPPECARTPVPRESAKTLVPPDSMHADTRDHNILQHPMTMYAEYFAIFYVRNLEVLNTLKLPMIMHANTHQTPVCYYTVTRAAWPGAT